MLADAPLFGTGRGRRPYRRCFLVTATDFANPAVTIARALTDMFSGIRPSDIPGFIAAEGAGTAAAVVMFRWLLPNAMR